MQITYDYDSVETALNEGIREIEFLKKDGTTRKMRATRNPKFCPDAPIPKKSLVRLADSIRCIDVDKAQWRSFLVANLIKI